MYNRSGLSLLVQRMGQGVRGMVVLRTPVWLTTQCCTLQQLYHVCQGLCARFGPRLPPISFAFLTYISNDLRLTCQIVPNLRAETAPSRISLLMCSG